jgi:hypothetical protein
LPLLIPNFDGEFLGWIPWNYAGNRKIKKVISIVNGPQTPGASIAGWQAELYIPYELLRPLRNMPPTSGTAWRANFYRNDYDAGEDPTRWEWNPTGGSYHAFEKFGVLVFD